MILVTGCAGLLGSHLTYKLLSENHSVMGMIHKNNSELLFTDNLSLFCGDITKKNDIATIFKTNKIDTVFHTAAHMPYNQNPNMLEVNAKGTSNLLYYAEKYGVKNFIYCSSISVYSKPLQYLPVDEKHPTSPADTYGISKKLAELSCNKYSECMDITILRFAGIYGQGMDLNRAIPMFIRKARNNEPLVLDGDGKHVRDFVYVEDVVNGMYQAWQSKATGVYNIGSGQSPTMIELANTIKQLTKSNSKIILSHNNLEQSYDFRLEINKAVKTFGFKPHSLQEGLSEYISEDKL